MKNKKEWETKSLGLIHKVREEIDAEISRQGIAPAQWIKDRGRIDVETLCEKLGLKNYTILIDRVETRGSDDEARRTRKQAAAHR
jgi:hypothetical protein